jgi:hypothetical protein
VSTGDVWCALNSSAGGPLLALVTIGGFLAAGKSIITFPKVFEDTQVADRNRKNRFRRWVLLLAIFTAVLLLVDVLAYVYAFSNVRNIDKVCVDKFSESALCSIWIFFICIIVTAVVGSLYAYFLTELKSTDNA